MAQPEIRKSFSISKAVAITERVNFRLGADFVNPFNIVRQSESRGNSPTLFNMPSNLQDQTVRMIVRTSLGGRRVRVNLSNSQGKPLVQVGSAHIAVHKAGGAIDPGDHIHPNDAGNQAMADAFDLSKFRK